MKLAGGLVLAVLFFSGCREGGDKIYAGGSEITPSKRELKLVCVDGWITCKESRDPERYCLSEYENCLSDPEISD